MGMKQLSHLVVMDAMQRRNGSVHCGTSGNVERRANVVKMTKNDDDLNDDKNNNADEYD
jgi:hypothetical protein